MISPKVLSSLFKCKEHFDAKEYDQCVSIALRHYRNGNFASKLQAGHLIMLSYIACDNLDQASKYGNFCFHNGLMADSVFLTNFSTLKRLQKKCDIALKFVEQAATYDPKNANAYFVKGNILQDMERYNEAIEAFNYGLSIDYRPEQLANIGNAHFSLGDREAAKYFMYRCLEETDNKSLNAWQGLAGIARKERDFSLAEIAYQHALSINTQFPEGHLGIAELDLMHKNWQNGWLHYTWRFRASHTHKRLPWPEWQGNYDASISLIVVSEQGYGDIFMAARYMQPLIHRCEMIGMKLKFLFPKEVSSLMNSNFGDQYIAKENEIKDKQFSHYIYLMDLMRIFAEGNTVGIWDVPYLSASQVNKRQSDLFTIGYAWRGRSQPDPMRSMKLTELTTLWSVGDWYSVSLQMDASEEERKLFNNCLADKTTWETTALWIDQCDLIITIDTSIAHLAGAMGKGTFCMAPYSPDWRWHFADSDTLKQRSRWYPTMMVYRQAKEGDWSTVIDAVKQDLTEYL